METLLGTSRVLLFGRLMDDLQVVQATAFQSPVRLVAPVRITPPGQKPKGHISVDGKPTAKDDLVLLTKQVPPSQNGIWKVGTANADWTQEVVQPQPGQIVVISEPSTPQYARWVRRWTGNPEHFRFIPVRPGGNPNLGKNNQLGDQLEGASFARIYGFSYDGTYYELPRPVLFLVHGEGEQVTDPTPVDNAARAPTDPSITGVAAADFQFADELRVWSYDKADYTIRMDVETGMFEQVLLDIFFDGGGGGGVSGARVSGARVSGARVSGARVSGARVSGARVGGPRGDASD